MSKMEKIWIYQLRMSSLVLTALTIYAAILYNNLVSLKHHISKTWANIDVLLKQCHDELPKLVDTCKQYMAYEKGTLEKSFRQGLLSSLHKKKLI